MSEEKFNNFIAMVKLQEGNYNREQFIKKYEKQQVGVFNISRVSRLANLFDGAYYSFEIVKYFCPCLNKQDIEACMRLVDGGYYKFEVVKLYPKLAGKITKDHIFGILTAFEGDYYKFEAIKYFKNEFFTVNDAKDLMLIFNNSYSMQVLDLFPDFFALSKDDLYNFIDTAFSDDINENIFEKIGCLLNSDIPLEKFKTDECRLRICKKISNLIYSKIPEILLKFVDEKYKFFALKEFNFTRLDPDTIVAILSVFDTELLKYKALLHIRPTYFKAWKGTIAQFTNSAIQYEVNCMFYDIKQEPQEILKSFKSIAYAKKFIAKYKIDPSLLIESDYSIIESVEEIEDDDIEDILEEDIMPDSPIITITRDMVPSYFQSMVGECTYNTETGEIRGSGMFGSSIRKGNININGYDLYDTLVAAAKPAIKNGVSLKVPLDWKDEKANLEADECIVCIDRKRQVIFNCGHYHTCAKCSRKLVREKQPCPMCRTAISSVARVFA